MSRNVVSIIITGQDLSSDQLKGVNANLEQMGQNLQRVGKIGMASGLALAGGLAFAVKGYADMEKGIKNALTLVDAQGVEFERMEEGMTGLARKLSLELGQSATEISEGFYQVLSAGAKAGTEGFRELIEISLKLARTSRLETAVAVEMLADTVNAFRFELSETERVANVFFTTSKLVATTIGQLNEAMTTAAPTAASLNVDLETTATTLAALAAQGVKAGEAGTAFRQILLRLSAPTDAAKNKLAELNVTLFDEKEEMRDLLDVFEELRVSMQDMTDKQRTHTLETLVGDRAFSKFGIILGTTNEQMRAWRNRLSEAGSLQKGFDTQMSSLSAKFAILKETAQATRIEIGSALAPAVIDMVNYLTQAAAGAAEFAAQNHALFQALAGVSIGLIGVGGVVFALGAGLRMFALITANMGAFLAVVPGVLYAFAAIAVAIGLYHESAKQANEELHRTERMLRELDGKKAEVTIVIKTIKKEVEEELGIDDTLEHTKEELNRLFIDKLLATGGADEGPMDSHVRLWASLMNNKLEAMKLDPIDPPEIKRGAFLYALSNDLRDAIIEINEENIDVPTLKIWKEGELEEMVAKAQWATQTIERALSSGLGRMLTDTNKFRDSITAMWKSIASSIISEIARMISKWLVAKAIMSIPSLPFGGAGAIPQILLSPFIKGQGGGTVTAGTRGVDNVHAAIGRGETILDHNLTDALREFLAGGGGLTIVNQPMLSTASNYESNRMSRVVNNNIGSYRTAFLVEGEL